jgi:HK97 family phage prohead protease
MGKTIEEIKQRQGQKDGNGLEYKRFTATEFKVDEEKGIVEAYVSIFDNIDLYGDKIIKGAFAESLQKKYPKGVWMHMWEQPIAKTVEAREDDKGLYIKGQFNLDTQRGKDAFSDIKFGIIDEFSIGFRVLDHEWQEDGTRILKKIRLYEWSPVLAGANPETELINVKGDTINTTLGKVDFVKTNVKTGEVVIYVRDQKPVIAKMSFKYLSYLKSLLVREAKVEPIPDNQKVLRIRQVAKQIDKATEFILKITK